MASTLSKHVYFVGFMGAGKSTVARRLARNLGIASLDMDSYIQRSTGKTINEIFEESGEDGFRKIETEVLRELSQQREPLLISCGGGAVILEENRKIMHDHGFVVHLLVDADEAASRIRDKSSRPLFNDIESARKRCRERLPIYEDAADCTILTGGKSVHAISREVTGALRREGILCQQQG